MRRSNSAWALSITRSTSPTCAARTARRCAHAHRLVPLGLQHPARASPCSRWSGNRRRARPRSEGHAAGADRPGPHRRPRKSQAVKDLWNYGDPLPRPIRSTPDACATCGVAAHADRLGQAAAQGPRAGHRRAPQLPELRRHGRACRAVDEQAIQHPTRWIPRSTAASPSTRSGSARRSRAPRSWARAGEKLRRSPSRTGGCSRATSTTSWSRAATSSPTGRARHIVPHRWDMPSSGVGEPGLPPFAPALLQRDLRRHRQADPRPADRRPADEGLISLSTEVTIGPTFGSALFFGPPSCPSRRRALAAGSSRAPLPTSMLKVEASDRRSAQNMSSRGADGAFLSI